MASIQPSTSPPVKANKAKTKPSNGKPRAKKKPPAELPALPILNNVQEPTHQGSCADCAGLCCRYITIQIEPPENDVDLDNLRWYLIHDRISLLVEDTGWMVKVDSLCQHLGADNRCTIYHNRPHACREYSTDDCDYLTWKGGYPAAYREFKDFKRLKQFVEEWWWNRDNHKK